MDVDASTAPLPGTPIQEPLSPEPATGLDGGASVGTTGQPASSGFPIDPMHQIMVLMQSLIQMNIDKEKSANHRWRMLSWMRGTSAISRRSSVIHRSGKNGVVISSMESKSATKVLRLSLRPLRNRLKKLARWSMTPRKLSNPSTNTSGLATPLPDLPTTL